MVLIYRIYCIRIYRIVIFIKKFSEPEKVAEAPAPEPAPPILEESVPLQTGPSSSAISGGEQTTLVHNEEEAFALEPLDVTHVPGMIYFSLCFLYFSLSVAFHLSYSLFTRFLKIFPVELNEKMNNHGQKLTEIFALFHI